MSDTIPPSGPRWASLPEASLYGGPSPKTLRRWIARGLLPGYRLGPTRLRIDLNDLDALIQRVVPASTPQDAV